MIIKKISFFCSLLLFLSAFEANAQIGSTYSMVGLGDVASGGFGQNTAMGGIGIGVRSNLHLNNLNPASYSSLDSLSVIYELGFSGGFNRIESSEGSTTKKDSKFDYIALGFNVKPFWGMGFGLVPSTRVNYTLLSETSNAENGAYDKYYYGYGGHKTYYHGNGGLTRAYWTNSFNIVKNLSVGVRAGYIFGSIQRITSISYNPLFYFADGDLTTPLYLNQNNTKYEYKININDFVFDYGVQYTQPLNEDDKLTIGLVFQNQMRMKGKVDEFGITTNLNEYTEGIMYDIDNGGIVDTVAFKEDAKTTVTLPSSFGGGLTYTHKDVLLVGADVYVDNWSELSGEEIIDAFENSISYKGGLEWTPDANSVNNYFKRVHYRFGGHYTKSHLVINNEQINDYGLSFGFGFPMRNSKTSFNITGEIGQRGTTEQNLLKETYGIISLNLSLSDIWFFKRKFK